MSDISDSLHCLGWGPEGVYIGLSDPTKPCYNDDDLNYNNSMKCGNADDDTGRIPHICHFSPRTLFLDKIFLQPKMA